MTKDLFVFSSDEDGISMMRYTVPEFLTALAEGDFGEKVQFIKDIKAFGGFFNSANEDSLLVICGEIVQFKPVQTVVQWTIADS